MNILDPKNTTEHWRIGKCIGNRDVRNYDLRITNYELRAFFAIFLRFTSCERWPKLRNKIVNNGKEVISPWRLCQGSKYA
ncbi:hypothetical protein Y032_0002g1078 [Ancylostoma ceylanicum]|uniref:Uncharacterized protein n=1 Tax=Ancylostoma ceylanicum TaxID=53326 RepID=A0A016VZB5_9BILA|nr:hypothetical protein Y032_0002g1078 [Ancylostoma ceylanicum]